MSAWRHSMFSTKNARAASGSPAAVVVVVACSRERPRPPLETMPIHRLALVNGGTNMLRRIRNARPARGLVWDIQRFLRWRQSDNLTVFRLDRSLGLGVEGARGGDGSVQVPGLPELQPPGHRLGQVAAYSA